MPRSLRARLIIASVLWTAGLLALMHMFSMLVVHVLPAAAHFPHALAPILAGIGLMVAGFLTLRRSLTPFRQLHDRLTAVRGGSEQRVAGEYASEVQPLIDELNALLEDREKAVKRALDTAGDLAHGLKTPLALLTREADAAMTTGNPALAESIAQQVERMTRQVNYQLARARAAASGPAAATCEVAVCVEALIRAVRKLHAGRALSISSTVAPELRARVHREDLEEMLGNLLDNACKWARSRITLEASRDGGMLSLVLDDDGPGLAPPLRTVVLERGVRADEAAPGHGLGLAIVRTLSEVYGGSIVLDYSPLGGLRVRLSLPGR